jgi:hypothetical protein
MARLSIVCVVVHITMNNEAKMKHNETIVRHNDMIEQLKYTVERLKLTVKWQNRNEERKTELNIKKNL